MVKQTRKKLGLALAGGGFRAALFHLGVLKRMAELDLLRRVEVLSTVSGGSIIGALYILLLKRKVLSKLLDIKNKTGEKLELKADDYKDIVHELSRVLKRGIQRNLRLRLLINPLSLLGILFTPYSLAGRMVRIYERYLFNEIVDDLMKKSSILCKGKNSQITYPPLRWLEGLWRLRYLQPLIKWLWPGRIRLADISITWPPEESGQMDSASECTPQIEFNDGHFARTKLVINATTINSGARFLFSASEIGDWLLGYFQFDNNKLNDIIGRKNNLTEPLRKAIAKHKNLATFWLNEKTTKNGKENGYEEHQIFLAKWLVWLRNNPHDHSCFDQVFESNSSEKQQCLSNLKQGGIDWEHIVRLEGVHNLLRADAGQLRRIKLLIEKIQAHRECLKNDKKNCQPLRYEDDVRLWEAVRRIDDEIGINLEKYAKENVTYQENEKNRESVEEFFKELYLIRSARDASRKIKKDWKRLTLGDAVGSSACFPPAFPAMNFYGIYDDASVTSLGLTDGGVFDNMGLFGLLDEGCSDVIISNTGGISDQQRIASSSQFALPGRIMNILAQDLNDMQKELLHEKKGSKIAVPQNGVRQANSGIARVGSNVESLLGFDLIAEFSHVAYFQMNSTDIPDIAAYLDRYRMLDGLTEEDQGKVKYLHEARSKIAKLRTDLDGFGDIEIAALEGLGYLTAESRIRCHFNHQPNDKSVTPNLTDKDPDYSDYIGAKQWETPLELIKALKVPSPKNDVSKFDKIIHVGRKRFFRIFCFFPSGWSFLSFGVALIVIYITMTYLLDLPILKLSTTIAITNASLQEVINILLFNLSSVAGMILALGKFLVARNFIALTLISCFLLASAKRLKSNHPTIWKWAKAWTGLLFMIIPSFVIYFVGLVTSYALIGFIFFYLPFLFYASQKKLTLKSFIYRIRDMIIPYPVLEKEKTHEVSI